MKNLLIFAKVILKIKRLRVSNNYVLKNFKQTNNIFEVTVDFVSEIISCVKDKEKKIVSGNPEKVKKVYDTWKFCRSIKSASPNWLLIDTQA